MLFVIRPLNLSHWCWHALYTNYTAIRSHNRTCCPTFMLSGRLLIIINGSTIMKTFDTKDFHDWIHCQFHYTHLSQYGHLVQSLTLIPLIGNRKGKHSKIFINETRANHTSAFDVRFNLKSRHIRFVCLSYLYVMFID